MTEPREPRAREPAGVPSPPPPEHPTHEGNESLWWISVSPAIWIAHFLATYLTAAVYCAKAGGDAASLTSVRAWIVAYTVVALAGVVAVGVRGRRRHRIGGTSGTHDFDTHADRHRFLGFASLLLSGLSAVGVLFVTLPVLFIGTCR